MTRFGTSTLISCLLGHVMICMKIKPELSNIEGNLETISSNFQLHIYL